MELTWNAGAARNAAPLQSTPLKVGLLGTINELDPRKAVDYVSGLILDQIFEPPYGAIAGLASAEPRLFEPLRSEDSRKGLQYSAAIRSGMFFSDGTLLTAELAARSLRGAGVLAGKATVEVRGDRVWFTLSSPNPRFDLTLAQSSCSIVLDVVDVVDVHDAHDVHDVHDREHQLLGTGPHMFDERPNLRSLQRSPRLRLVRNPHCHGTTRVDEIEFHILQPENDGVPRKLIEALRNGRIDVTTALSAADLVKWNVSGVAPFTTPSNSTAFLYMNTSRPPFNAAPARRAIAASIDLLEIASKTYDRNPAAFVATTALPPSMCRSTGTVHSDSADRGRLIRESGLHDTRLTLLLPWCPRPYLPKLHAVAEIIQRRLDEAGVTISITETHGSDDYFRALSGGRFDLALGGWIADTPDPADYFDALLSSQAIGNGSFANHSRWADPETDAILQRFRVDPSETNRRAIEALIADERPFLPLIHGQSCVVHTRRIRNIAPSPTGSISLARVTLS